jgi:hypothetical protein
MSAASAASAASGKNVSTAAATAAAAAGGGSSYSFPALKEHEIVGCLSELGMSVSPAQLREPSEEVVRPIFEKLTELLKGSGSSRAEMQQMDFQAMVLFAYAELHEESIGEVVSLAVAVACCCLLLRNSQTASPARRSARRTPAICGQKAISALNAVCSFAVAGVQGN